MASDLFRATLVAIPLVVMPAVADGFEHFPASSGVRHLADAGTGDAHDLLDDEWIVVQVKAQLADDPSLQSSAHIEVESTNGAVSLRGRVSSEAARMRVLELARAAPGVVKVVDQLEVRAR